MTIILKINVQKNWKRSYICDKIVKNTGRVLMKQSKHLIEARRTGILKEIQNNKKVRVEDLSKNFQVSDLTIRRDLEELEKRGEIRRFFGGAEIINEIIPEAKYDEKKVSNSDEKMIIAEYTAKLVNDETSIFMNSGTTVVEVMKRLVNKKATIITNNALAGSIMEKSNGELLCTGGIYNINTKSYVGEYSANLIRETYAEMAILGVNGISAESGITTSIFQETVLFRLMLERCRGLKIVVADGSKIGRTRNYKSADIDMINILITTTKADMVELDKIRKSGVEVILADKK